MTKKANRKYTQRKQPKEKQSSDFFSENYTRTEDGFYVRNSNPSSGVYDDKRLIANIRSLLRSAVASD